MVRLLWVFIILTSLSSAAEADRQRIAVIATAQSVTSLHVRLRTSGNLALAIEISPPTREGRVQVSPCIKLVDRFWHELIWNTDIRENTAKKEASKGWLCVEPQRSSWAYRRLSGCWHAASRWESYTRCVNASIKRTRSAYSVRKRAFRVKYILFQITAKLKMLNWISFVNHRCR